MPDQIQIAADDRVFILTGAGISAESGLPTFRGAGGMWRTYRVEEVASPEAWERDPKLVWEFYSMRRRAHGGKEPNAGHRALAQLQEAIGERLFLCTQNVDCLHEMAGSRGVVHMHGELFKSRCDRCARPPFADTQTYEDAVPRCPCGGQIRPHICWFGETPYEMDRIFAALEDCTVFVAIGTSGVVEPAASFVGYARGRGKRVRSFYVGPEEPANRAHFNTCLLGPATQVLPGLFRCRATESV